RQHGGGNGEHRGGGDSRRALGDDHGGGIVQSEELDVVHARQQTQVGGVVERVPVADLDGGDADLRRHYAPVSRIRAAYRSRTGSTSSVFAGGRLNTTRATPASR